MRLYSSITTAELGAIAQRLDMSLYQYDHEDPATRGKYAGRERHRFLLRPTSDRYRLVRDNPYSASGMRRVWAVSWRGHRDFMRAVFAIDPAATFVTALDTWRDAVDFERRHATSGERNIGSMIHPQSYRDAEAA